MTNDSMALGSRRTEKWTRIYCVYAVVRRNANGQGVQEWYSEQCNAGLPNAYPVCAYSPLYGVREDVCSMNPACRSVLAKPIGISAKIVVTMTIFWNYKFLGRESTN